MPLAALLEFLDRGGGGGGGGDASRGGDASGGGGGGAERRYYVVDCCSGKGYLSMLLSYLATMRPVLGERLLGVSLAARAPSSSPAHSPI